MKMKITKNKNYDVLAEENKCPSCAGSGRYDSWDVKKNKPIECGACNGDGKKIR